MFLEEWASRWRLVLTHASVSVQHCVDGSLSRQFTVFCMKPCVVAVPASSLRRLVNLPCNALSTASHNVSAALSTLRGISLGCNITTCNQHLGCIFLLHLWVYIARTSRSWARSSFCHLLSFATEHMPTTTKKLIHSYCKAVQLLQQPAASHYTTATTVTLACMPLVLLPPAIHARP